jgi:hypothetical protein
VISPAHARRVAKRWAVLLALAGAAGCGGESHGDERTLPVSPADTLEYRQEYGGLLVDNVRYFHGTGPRGRFTPMVLSASVRAVPANRREPVLIPNLAENPLEVRLHTNPERQGDAVWSSLRAEQDGCIDQISRFDADEREWSCQFDVPTVLGDSLPAAKYYFTTLLRFAHDSLEFAEGSGFLSPDTLPPIHGLRAVSKHLRFGLETRIGANPDNVPHWDASLIVVVPTAANVGDRRVELRYGGCPVRVSLHTDSDRTEPPAWRLHNGCEDIEIITVVSPGEETDLRRLSTPLLPHRIISDSVPPGRYYVSGEYRIGTKVAERHGPLRDMTEDTVIWQAAGSILLQR